MNHRRLNALLRTILVPGNVRIETIAPHTQNRETKDVSRSKKEVGGLQMHIKWKIVWSVSGRFGFPYLLCDIVNLPQLPLEFRKEQLEALETELDALEAEGHIISFGHEVPVRTTFRVLLQHNHPPTTAAITSIFTDSQARYIILRLCNTLGSAVSFDYEP